MMKDITLSALLVEKKLAEKTILNAIAKETGRFYEATGCAIKGFNVYFEYTPCLGETSNMDYVVVASEVEIDFPNG